MKRTLPIVIVLVFFVVAGGLFFASRSKSAGAGGATQYKLAKAETGQVKKTVSATGILQPWTVVDIKSKAGGRVDALLVDVGAEVRKGQKLVLIDPADTLLNYSTAQADIDSARAREMQSDSTYRLQVQQSTIAVANAEASLNSARASRAAAAARLRTAQTQAKTQPELTKAAIAQAQANYEQAVKQRKALDATNPQQIASAKAAYDQAVANRNNAKANLDRQSKLMDKGFVSEQALDTAQANFDVLVAQVTSAKTRLDQIEAELLADVQAADARIAQVKAALDNAKANAVDVPNRQNSLRESQAAVQQADAQVAQAEAALRQARANRMNNQIRRFDIDTAKASKARATATMINAKNTLDQATVRAPSDGVILKKYVEEGTIITSGLSLNSTGTSILQIGDVTKMYVDVTVDETDIANVDEGQSVDVAIEAYPGIPFEGKVARVDPQAVVEQNVTSFHVRVEIDNSSPTFRLLKPGMNSTCEFVIDEKEDVVSVPNEAIQADDNGQFIEVGTGGTPAPPDPKTGAPADPGALIAVKLERRVVEVGVEGNETTEIVSGLKEGESVVVEKIEPEPETTTSPFAGGRGFGGGGRR